MHGTAYGAEDAARYLRYSLIVLTRRLDCRLNMCKRAEARARQHDALMGHITAEGHHALLHIPKTKKQTSERASTQDQFARGSLDASYMLYMKTRVPHHKQPSPYI